MVLSELAPVVITTCVRYWDYLDATLPHTLEFASKVYIVTDEPRILEDPKVEIIATQTFTANGASFNKSGVVRETQERVHAAHPNSWILLMDADIVADADLCHDINCKSTLYSVSRQDYATPTDFMEDRGTPYHTPGAGYFQLYFDKTKLYPAFSEDASECDMAFYRQFSRHRILGGAVKHLGEHTVNWKGRVSTQWKREYELEGVKKKI